MSSNGSTKWAHAQKLWAKELNIGDDQGKCVLKELADRANKDQGCWGSQVGIAKHCGKSRRTTQTHIERLAKAGYILVYERRGNRGAKLDDGYILVGHEAPTKPPHEVLECQTVILKDFLGEGCYWGNKKPNACATIAHSYAQPSPVAMRSHCAQSCEDIAHSHAQPLPTSCYDIAHDTLISTKLHLNSTTKLQKEEMQTESVSGLAQTEVEERSQSSLAPLEDSGKKQAKSKPPPPPKKSKPDRTQHFEELLAIWNANCGKLPKAESLNPPRRKHFEKMLRNLELDEAKVKLKEATKEVAQDEWWQRKPYGLDNLLAGEKYYQKSEQYRARSTQNQHVYSPETYVPNDLATRRRLLSVAYGEPQPWKN